MLLTKVAMTTDELTFISDEEISLHDLLEYLKHSLKTQLTFISDEEISLHDLLEYLKHSLNNNWIHISSVLHAQWYDLNVQIFNHTILCYPSREVNTLSWVFDKLFDCDHRRIGVTILTQIVKPWVSRLS